MRWIDRKDLFAALLPAVLVLAVGCDSAPPDAATDPDAQISPVDSIFPVEEEIRRFRATLGEAPDTLRRTETELEGVVLRFVRAVEEADTATLAGMSLDRAEFAYLYYPDSRYTRPPYQLSPALTWYRMQNLSGRGLTRLMRRYAGVSMGYIGYECPDEPAIEGENRFWHGCVILHEEGPTDGGDSETSQGSATASEDASPDGVRRIRLFGSIMERDGRYKLVGYSNDL